LTSVQLPPKERILKYAAASMVGVTVGSSTLLLLLALDVQEVLANFLSVAISSVPAYIVNRYWVWQKKDANSLKREVVPFWGMAFLGLVLSSVFVNWAKDRTDESLLILAANLSGFGVLWVAKFFVLDKFLFGATPEEHLEPPPLL
jgi:putative flippase GtrA